MPVASQPAFSTREGTLPCHHPSSPTMVSWLHLWTYYQAPDYLLGGVIWSNIWFSGLLGVSCYGAIRLALRWEAARSARGVAENLRIAPTGRRAGGVEVRDATAVPVLGRTEERLRMVAMGAAGIWAAFYACTLVQLLFWYAVVAPWVASPRPF